MAYNTAEEKVQISQRSQNTLNLLLEENPELKNILLNSKDDTEVNQLIKEWAEAELSKNPIAYQYFKNEITGRKAFEKIKWQDTAAIRILDYINHTDHVYIDLNVRGQKRKNTPFRILWLAAKYGTSGAKYFFFVDMLQLFRQFSGLKKYKTRSREQIEEWMDRHPSGLDTEIIEIRQKNKDHTMYCNLKYYY